MKLTTQFHLVLGLRKTGTIPLFPLYALTVWTGTALSVVIFIDQIGLKGWTLTNCSATTVFPLLCIQFLSFNTSSPEFRESTVLCLMGVIVAWFHETRLQAKIRTSQAYSICKIVFSFHGTVCRSDCADLTDVLA